MIFLNLRRLTFCGLAFINKGKKIQAYRRIMNYCDRLIWIRWRFRWELIILITLTKRNWVNEFCILLYLDLGWLLFPSHRLKVRFLSRFLFFVGKVVRFSSFFTRLRNRLDTLNFMFGFCLVYHKKY